MTKEQRELVENLLRTTIVGREVDMEFWRNKRGICARDIAAYTAALAILTDEAERDRKLGAAVREGIRRYQDSLAHMADDCDRLTRWSTPGVVLRTIAQSIHEASR